MITVYLQRIELFGGFCIRTVLANMFHPSFVGTVVHGSISNRSGIFTIEVQLSAKPGLTQRVVFYGCEVYAGQLLEGDDYSELKPVYTICLYRGTLWTEDSVFHHRFQLADVETGRILEETVAIHLVELSKYNMKEEELVSASPSDRWLFWLLYSNQYSSEELVRLFPELAIQRATVALNNINLITKDKQMYDLRKKAEIDYNWGLKAAKREGREEGIGIGESAGRKKEIVKTIHFCQSILAVPQTPLEELEMFDVNDLDKIATDLQSQVRGRAT